MGRGGFFVAPVVVETDAHPLVVACVGRNSVPLPAFKEHHKSSNGRALDDLPLLLCHGPRNVAKCTAVV